MEVTLYMPYYDYNDGAFDVNSNYYDDNEYIEAVSKEYNKNKDIIYNAVYDRENGGGGLIGSDGQTYKFGSNTAQKEEKVAYSSCKGIVYDENGNDDTVDNLITHFVNQKPFIEMLEFDDNTSEEEFIAEVSLWVKEHNAINKYKDYKGEEWTWLKEPKRNVKMHFVNKAGEDIYAILENCKIMDIVDGNSMIIFIEKLRLIDEIK